MTESNGFEIHFSQEYGSRWESIFASLKTPPLQVLRQNRFFKSQNQTPESEKKLIFENCFLPSEKRVEDLEIRDDVFKYYLMDPASVVVGESIPIKPGDRVLDMCAAPGGKSLILAEKLFLEAHSDSGELLCNELSNPRRERLKYILQNYIPRDKRNSTFIKGIDGNYYGQREPEKFDAILLDAPCTGERHLIEDASEFKKWNLKRSKNNSMRQFSLLSSAWHAVRVGGYVMYSTCSISSAENDDVIKKLQKRRAIEVVQLDLNQKYPFVEKTEFGYQILPDTRLEVPKGPDSLTGAGPDFRTGAGPMYFSLIRKLDELTTEAL